MQISPKQIQLGRQLIDWTQENLAKNSGVSKQTIINIENAIKSTKQDTLKKVITALEKAGVEFLEGDGVRKRQVNIKRYYSIEGFKAFMDDVYMTAKEHGGDICLANSRPSLWHELLGKEWYEEHSKRMAALGDHIRVRITVQRGDKDFVLESAEHRWLKKSQWRGKVFYAYGAKLGLLNFIGNTVHITVLEEADFTEEFRIMFDSVWENDTQAPTE